MRVTLKLDTSNKYNTELWCGNQLIARGGDGIVDVELTPINNGKRMGVTLTLANVNVIVTDTKCPEEHRYETINSKVGDHSALKELNLTCDMLKVDPNACVGCHMRPPIQDEVKQTSALVG